MDFLKDEKGQGAAEYVLLFGGVIVIVVAAFLIIQQWFTGGIGSNASSASQELKGNLTKT